MQSIVSQHGHQLQPSRISTVSVKSPTHKGKSIPKLLILTLGDQLPSPSFPRTSACTPLCHLRRNLGRQLGCVAIVVDAHGPQSPVGTPSFSTQFDGAGQLLMCRTEVQLVPARQDPVKGLQWLSQHHIVPTAMLYKCKRPVLYVGTGPILEQRGISNCAQLGSVR